jgi:peptidyl-prolyl cis-trans isomerase SurA
MLKIKILAVSALLLFTTTIMWSQDATIATVNGKAIKQSELNRRYAQRSDAYKNMKPNEYLKELINIKLKKEEALRLSVDTTFLYKKDFTAAQERYTYPYLYDTIKLNNLAKEAYDRFSYDIEAQQVLVLLDPWASPADTLKAYNKLLEARGKLLAGEPFAKIAAQYSADMNASQTGGKLGYFSAFRMLYPFETAAYNLKIGEISMPVRTSNGYHLIQVTNKRPSRGEINLGIISIRSQNPSMTDSAYIKIMKAHHELTSGTDYHTVYRKYCDFAKNPLISDETGWIGAGRLNSVFDSVAFSLTKEISISLPIANGYGWHMLKLLNKRPVGTFASRKRDMLQRIEQNERRSEPRNVVLNRLKKEYNPTSFTAAYAPLYKIKASSLILADSVKIQLPDSLDITATALSIGQKKYTTNQFIDFIQKNGSKLGNTPIKWAIDKLYNLWSDEMLLQYEKERLPIKYEAYKLKEADTKEEILAQHVTYLEIIKKAKADTSGLKAFYETNKTKYMWDKRLETFLVTGTDSVLMHNAYAYIRKIADGGDSLKTMNKQLETNFKGISIQHLLLDPATVPSAENTVALSDLTNYPGQLAFTYTTGLVPPMPKTLEEAKNEHLNDYIASLEKQWLDLLRKKYKAE